MGETVITVKAFPDFESYAMRYAVTIGPDAKTPMNDGDQRMAITGAYVHLTAREVAMAIAELVAWKIDDQLNPDTGEQ